MITKIVVAVVVLFIVGVILSGYVKAPTDKAYVISGLKKEPKVLIGRAGIKIPFLERKDELMLKQISIDIKTNGYIPTKDFIGVDIDAVAKVRVLTVNDINEEKGITSEMANAAMKNFLNMNEDRIREALTDSLQGNMREIIGTQTLKDLCQNRKTFGDEVQNKAQKDMNALGIYIESCNIQRIDDENNLINALGQDNMAQIQKDASIAKANADRDVAVAKAEAAKLANDAKIASDTDIAIKQNELKIKQAELKKQSDIKQAEADAAYEIQKQEQRKNIEIANQNANIAKQEKEVELKERDVRIAEQQLSANIKKKADADKYEAQQKSDAELYQRQKKAEAERYEAEQAAEALKKQAEADRYKKEQEAIGIQKVGEAEAKAIEAKGIAEAEALNKKAEAYQKFNQAAVAKMLIDVLPDVAGEIAKPLSQIDKITIIGGGENGVVDGVAGNVPGVMAKVFESMKETVGIDMNDLVKANGYDAKVTKNVNLTGIPGSENIFVEPEQNSSNTELKDPDTELKD